MEPQKLVAWILLGLLAVAIVVPTLVICILQPTEEHQVPVLVKGVLPLDAFFLLDASRSLSSSDWNMELEFARDMALMLNSSVPLLRAGMGQFATEYQLVFPLSSDISPFQGLPSLPEGMKRIKGETGMAQGLCGNGVSPPDDPSAPLEECEGGGFGQLKAAEPLDAHGSLDCGIERPVRLIILVTDGCTATPELTVAATRFIKQREEGTGATLMGILVSAERDQEEVQANAAELFALTSCCPAEKMSMFVTKRKGWTHSEKRPTCLNEVNVSCPQMVTRTGYQALLESTHSLVAALTQEMDCVETRVQTTFKKSWRALWFLVLLLPMAMYLSWQNILLCLSKSRLFLEETVRASLALSATEVELSPAGDAPADAEAAAEAPAEPPAEAPAEPPAEPQPAIAAEAGGGSGADGVRASAAARPTVTFDLPEGDARSSRGSAMHASTTARSSGKKWAPVRTAYIVGGQRMDVDYGASHGAPPSSAPIAARRGYEDPVANETPEAAFDRTPSLGASMIRAASVARMLSLRTVTRDVSVPFIGVPEEQLAPPLQKYNCEFAIPFLITLLMVPIVVWKSGVLSLFGITD